MASHGTIWQKESSTLMASHGAERVNIKTDINNTIPIAQPEQPKLFGNKR